MGCHAAAGTVARIDPVTGAAITRRALTGDFSWFLSQEFHGVSSGPKLPEP